MKVRFIYFGIVLMTLVSCFEIENVPSVQQKIEVEVDDVQSTKTRALLLDNKDDIINQGEFALNAYLKSGGEYFTNTWVYYFKPDDGAARWRFRDQVNPNNLINFYWPNDNKLNFLAYMPRELSNLNESACSVTNLTYVASSGVQFTAAMPAVIEDKTEAEREAENSKSEFVYATRLDQGKNDGSVKLRFVHPFAAIKFRLQQSHRDLTINYISLHGLNTSGNFSSNEDTYARYNNGANPDQDYITVDNWSLTATPGDFKINLSKSVPYDVNYQSQIGGPYVVIPQQLNSGSKDVKISVNYTWNDETVTSPQISISTSNVPSWLPGKIYTYILDLGDNKEEILFIVVLEEWDKGEDDDYENNYDVK